MFQQKFQIFNRKTQKKRFIAVHIYYSVTSHTDVQRAIISTKPVSVSGTVVSIGPSLTTGNCAFYVRVQRGGT